MNIMIVTNSKYLMPTYVMLYSLIIHHKDEEMGIYLVYEDLKEKEIEGVQKFVESFPKKKLYSLYVGKEFKRKVTSRNGIQIETYYRILGIELLPLHLKRILYLDVDMVIKGSLQDLYHIDLCERPFAACEDIYGIINGFHTANKSRLQIPEQYSYFNAGTILFNLDYFRSTHAAEEIIKRIYKNYQRYEYNDQDVLNEMYYDKVLLVGWDEYNCPPAWYYIDKIGLTSGKIGFADYNKLSEMADQVELVMEKYQNITEQVYQNAKIIHYLGNTKPWSESREESRIYQLFDRAYDSYALRFKNNFKIFCSRL